jgi:tetratricopeptide (TPR) repeat protein
MKNLIKKARLSVIEIPVKALAIAVLIMLTSACASIRMEPGFSRDAAIESAILSQTVDAFPEIKLLELDQEIIDYLSAHIRLSDHTSQKIEKLQELLFNENYLNIQYVDSANYSAVETFRARQANCLSLVNLFIAMARHVGLDAQYQTVQIRPRWDLRGELLILSEHINATGRVNHGARYIVDFTPELSLQQRTASVVSDTRARALYFNNLGVEKLIVREYDEALAYLKNALWIDPELAIAWNNAGAVYNRLAMTELAEYSYQRSFDIDKSSSTSINNLAKFYYAQQDFEKADLYNQAIRRFNNKNPYYHFLLGNLAYSDGNFDRARRHYYAAIKRKDIEPDFYFAMSQAYQQLGMQDQAQQMLARAAYILELSDEAYRPSQEKLRIIQGNTIFRSSNAGFSIFPNGL